jgi:hypothetical protein
MPFRSKIAALPEPIRDDLNRRLQTKRKKLQLWKREIDLLERRVKLLELNRLDPAAHPATPNPSGGLSTETLERIRREAHLL